jgi:hypothetical protein
VAMPVSPEDKIKARLRELTHETRRLRHELEELIRPTAAPLRALACDREHSPAKKKPTLR